MSRLKGLISFSQADRSPRLGRVVGGGHPGLVAKVRSTVWGGDEGTQWAAMTAVPVAALDGLVLGYAGFRESSGRPVVRRKLPTSELVLVLNLAEPLTVRRSSSAPGAPVAFLAGVGHNSLTTSHAGHQVALEVRLSALAADSLFGVPAGQLAEQVVDLTELWGRAAAELVERAAAAASWRDRFGLPVRRLPDGAPEEGRGDAIPIPTGRHEHAGPEECHRSPLVGRDGAVVNSPVASGVDGLSSLTAQSAAWRVDGSRASPGCGLRGASCWRRSSDSRSNGKAPGGPGAFLFEEKRGTHPVGPTRRRDVPCAGV